ncbi:MAG: cytochrome c3 family protein [Chloroflexota bacterium]
MSLRKWIIILGVTLVGAVVLAACGTPGPAGPAGPAGPEGEPGPAAQASDLSCTECHNDTTLIVSKQAQFKELSVHGTGEAFIRGEGTACAGCHGTEGAKARINAGLPPHDESVTGVTNVSPFDCRTCHNIHTTYTKDDFSLTGDAQPVELEMTGGTFDGGVGNLCANCHQIRNALPVAVAGNIEVTSARFGTHYGVEAAMLLGEGGAGGVTGSPSAHYTTVENTCVACHMGDEGNHTYEPVVTRCVACHADATDFDVNGVQTEVQAMVDDLHAQFIARGMMDKETGLWIASAEAPATYPEAVGAAMWNYKLVQYDQSMGVHNTAFTKALLQQALDAMK